MSRYRLIPWAVLTVQLGCFGKLVLLHFSPSSPVASWSWWAICAPLYLPVLVALFLLVFAYVLDRIEQILYPTPDGSY
ncbi:hypothetical protein [Spirosoma aerolatum]|uniref:hypothetical protein n=1 Tax=Spirosoma aerolatum TaxID=1211326 RepID=UPI0009AD0009|nr:hypothetical protein [Spirosoma aerolatum]